LSEASRAGENDDTTTIAEAVSAHLRAVDPAPASPSPTSTPSERAGAFLRGDERYRGSEEEEQWVLRHLQPHLRACQHALEGHVREGTPKPAARRRATRGGVTRRIGFVIAIFGFSYGAYDVLSPHIVGEGMWRGAYHSQPNFKGKPDIIRDRDIDFNWRNKSPAPEIPNDKISIRWDTCITLDEDQDVAFQLIADDGARLFLDGTMVINNWKPAKSKRRKGVTKSVKGKELQLSSGRHHLRVEYRDSYGQASVQLLASFGLADPPAPIPASLLSYPGDRVDLEDPCKLESP
jgi:hypothetical protein